MNREAIDEIDQLLSKMIRYKRITKINNKAKHVNKMEDQIEIGQINNTKKSRLRLLWQPEEDKFIQKTLLQNSYMA